MIYWRSPSGCIVLGMVLFALACVTAILFLVGHELAGFVLRFPRHRAAARWTAAGLALACVAGLYRSYRK